LHNFEKETKDAAEVEEPPDIEREQDEFGKETFPERAPP